MSDKKVYAKEEINTIVNSILNNVNMKQGKMLSADDLKNVAGGFPAPDDAIVYEYDYPATHEEIDARWDAVQWLQDNVSNDAAVIAAIKFHIYSGHPSKFADVGIDYYRGRMHAILDGTYDGSKWSHH